MYGRGTLGVRRFYKECMERCNTPISYENTLLSFCSSINLTSVGAVGALGGGGGIKEKNHSQNLLGRKLERLGKKLPPPPPPPPHTLDRTLLGEV